MRWVDLAFLHWRAPVQQIRALVPPELELDLFENTAWLGVTPFRMTRVRPTFSPPIPTASDFPELNVRTYVTHNGRPGVWFFSLDAGSKLAVTTARTVVGLPYMHAKMSHKRVGESIEYVSKRTHSGAPAAEFRATYRGTGAAMPSQPRTLEHWLTERYSLFVRHLNRMWRLDIEHVPWSLQPGAVEIATNTMASAAGITLPPDPPHVRFSRTLDVVANRPIAL